MSIPGKVVKIKKRIATVETSGEKVDIDLGLNDDIKVGNYVLYASERIIRKISKSEAVEINTTLGIG